MNVPTIAAGAGNRFRYRAQRQMRPVSRPDGGPKSADVRHVRMCSDSERQEQQKTATCRRRGVLCLVTLSNTRTRIETDIWVWWGDSHLSAVKCHPALRG